MRLEGVEIDAVASVQHVILILVAHVEAALHHIDELGAGVNMVGHFDLFSLGEFGEVRLGPLVLGGVGEALEEEGGAGGIGTIGELHAFAGADDVEHAVFAAIGEEVIDADIEDHGDAGEGGEGRDELAILELGEHGGGDAGVAAEVHEGDFLA